MRLTWKVTSSIGRSDDSTMALDALENIHTRVVLGSNRRIHRNMRWQEMAGELVYR
jgi:hypothetical protein